MKLFFTYLFVFLFLHLQAQQPYLPHFTTNEGLPGNTVYQVVRDQQGFLWVATNNGICRFDGQTFQTFSLKGLINDVEFINIYLGNQERVWFVTFSGDVLLYDGIQFRAATTFFGRSFIKINQIFEDAFGFVWVVQKDGTIHKFDPKNQKITYIKQSWINFHNNTIIDIPKPNNIWIKAYQKVIEVGSKKIIFDAQKTTSLNTVFNGRTIKPLGKRKYIYASDKDISIYDNGQISVVEQGGLPYSQISFVETANQNVYIGTSTKGLFEYQLKGNSLIFKRNVLPKKAITYSTTDLEGNLWIGTYNDGLYCVPRRQSYQLDDWTQPNAEPLSIVKHRQALVVGFNNGTFGSKQNGLIKRYGVRSFTDDATLTSRIKHFRTFGNALWAVHDHILLKIEDEKVTLAGQIGSSPKDIAQADSLLLVATHSGIVCGTLAEMSQLMQLSGDNKNSAKSSQITKQMRLFENRTTAIAYDKYTQTCWAGLLNGLACFSRKDIEKWHQSRQMTTSLPSSPLPEVLQNFKYRINCLATLPNGGLVIGTTAAGVFLLKDNALYGISMDEGLSNNFCQNLFIDPIGVIWVSTVNGLNKIKIRNLKKNDYTISVFNQSQGLRSNIINDVAVRNDSVWVATPVGVTFLKDYQENKTAKIPIRITSVMVDGQVANWKAPIWHKENLTITFVAISFEQRNNLSYRYRLLKRGLFGSNTYSNWTQTNNQTAFFENLLSGSYDVDIEVFRKDTSLLLGGSHTPININVRWYQNWLVLYILVTLLLLSATTAAFVYYYRRERQKRVFSEQFNALERQAFQAQMNPHFIFNCLNAIQEFMFSNDSEQAQRYLSQFARLIRKTLDFTKYSTVSLSDEIDYLKLYIKLEQMRYEDPFRFELNIDNNLKIREIELPSLLLQPFVENAIRHGQLGAMHQRGLLKINFDDHNGQLQCAIDDNGIGLKQSRAMKDKIDTERTSHGLNIIKQRIELLNRQNKNYVRFSLLDKSDLASPSRGTLVHVVVKYA